MISQYICLLLLVISSVVFSHETQHDDNIRNRHYHGPEHHRRELTEYMGEAICGTQPPTETERSEMNAAVVGWFKDHPADDGTPRNVVHVQTYVHVITDGNIGAVSLESVTQNLNRLNEAYGPHGFQFNLARNPTFTDNSAWFNSMDGTVDEMSMKRRLRHGDARTLNIYIKNALSRFGQALGGYAYLPVHYCQNRARDGVVIHHNSVPGGQWGNDGDVLTHEVGHWLGLLHTFQNGCGDPGDDVRDTPPHQLSDLYTCDSPRDSCNFDSKSDPIHNYMNYLSTACMTEFTAGQRARMFAIWNQYRASGGDCLLTLCFSPDAKTIVKGKGQTSVKNIAPGDKVLTADGDYKTVYTINHYHHTRPTRFLQINTTLNDDNTRPLEITHKHMLFAQGKPHPVLASDINVGDFVHTMDGLQEVTNITSIVRQGFYNPITTDGTIVVDGIIASTYSSFIEEETEEQSWTLKSKTHVEIVGYQIVSVHTILHMTLAPYRAFCMGISLDLCNQHGEGKLPAAHYFAIQFYDFWLQQNFVVQFVILGIYVCLFGTLSCILDARCCFCVAFAIVLGWLLILTPKTPDEKQKEDTLY